MNRAADEKILLLFSTVKSPFDNLLRVGNGIQRIEVIALAVLNIADEVRNCLGIFGSDRYAEHIVLIAKG